MFKIENDIIYFVKGDSASWSPDLTDHSVGAGDTLTFTVKKNNGILAYISKTVSVNEPFVLVPNDTALMNSGNYWYDIQLNKANGRIDTIVPINRFVLLDEITASGDLEIDPNSDKYVASVNGKTGTVVLTASDVGAYSSDDLSPVAFSGSYDDLTDKPTIPEAYVLPIASTSTIGGVMVDGTTITINSSGVITSVGGGTASSPVQSVNGKIGNVVLTASDVGAVSTSTPLFSGNYNDLTNKPTIPTRTSELINDSSYTTSAAVQSSLSEYRTAAAQNIIDAGKQATLVSGENIKTINGYALTGSGNLVISGSGGADWGNIGGVMANQIDLQSALDALSASLASKATTSNLAQVAISGSYEDLTNKPYIPSPYVLPVATAYTLGGVKAGNGVSINGSGVISTTVYTAGSGIDITNGVISLDVENANQEAF